MIFAKCDRCVRPVQNDAEYTTLYHVDITLMFTNFYVHKDLCSQCQSELANVLKIFFVPIGGKNETMRAM